MRDEGVSLHQGRACQNVVNATPHQMSSTYHESAFGRVMDRIVRRRKLAHVAAGNERQGSLQARHCIGRAVLRRDVDCERLEVGRQQGASITRELSCTHYRVRRLACCRSWSRPRVSCLPFCDELHDGAKRRSLREGHQRDRVHRDAWVHLPPGGHKLPSVKCSNGETTLWSITTTASRGR